MIREVKGRREVGRVCELLKNHIKRKVITIDFVFGLKSFNLIN